MMKRGTATCVVPFSQAQEILTWLRRQIQLTSYTWTERFVELSHSKA